MSRARHLVPWLAAGLLVAAAAFSPARAAEPAQDENLAYAVGVQAYISGFPLLDLYRTLWETSFDSGRGHDRTLNEYFVFERLITSEDDWVITPNNDTIYLRAFLDLRAEPIVLVIPPMGDRQYWVPVSDMQHEEPSDPRERANWLPAPKGRCYLVTRHYSPQSPIMTGDWAPPAIARR